MVDRLLTHFAMWMWSRGRARMIYRTVTAEAPLEVKEEPYLLRVYLVRSKRFGLYLHRFFASDLDGLHTHPWCFGNVVLTGGYYEALLGRGERWRPAGSVALHTENVPHRIRIIVGGTPTWTLFWRGRRTGPWGFLPAGVERRFQIGG